jgi:hypothetical protein
MLLAALAPALAFVLVPWLVYRALGVPWPRAGYVRWAIFAGPGLFLAVASVEYTFGRATGLVVGITSCVALAVVSAARARRFKRIEGSCARLASSDAPAAFAELETELRALRTGHVRPRLAATWTLYIVQRALQADHPVRALAWLDLVPIAKLDRDHRAVHAQYLAAACVKTGDRARAREALAAAPRPAQPEAMEQALQATEALVDVLDGEAAAGGRAEKALAADVAPAARLAWQAVRAHALALGHEHEELTTLLRELRAAHGDEALARIVSHKGPASPHAATLLAARAPYR